MRLALLKMLCVVMGFAACSPRETITVPDPAKGAPRETVTVPDSTKGALDAPDAPASPPPASSAAPTSGSPDRPAATAPDEAAERRPIGPFSKWVEAFNLPGDLESFPPPRLARLADLPQTRGTLVYRRSGHLWKATLPSGKLVQLTHGAGAYAHPAWAPGGGRLAFATNREGGIYRVIVTDPEAAHVVWRGPSLRGDGICHVPPAFSRDGQLLLYGACATASLGAASKPGSSEDTELRLAHLGQPGDETVLGPLDIESASFSPDGKRIVVRVGRGSGPGEIRIVDLETRRGAALPTYADTLRGEPRWWTDREILLLSAPASSPAAPGTRLSLIDVGDGTRRRFAPGFSIPTERGTVVPSPDASRLAVAWGLRAGAQWHRDVMVLDAEGTVLGRLGARYPKPFYALSSPSWAPDSRHLVATLEICAYPGCEPPIRAVVIVDTQDPEQRLAFVEYGSDGAWRPEER